MKNEKIKYRPDIDGLRALAIISVVIYHANIYFDNFRFLSGGYLGVDIFFVVSGYLITSIIVKEINFNNKFNVLNFLESRSRRIFPVLLISLIFFLPIGYLLLLPSLLIEFSQSQIFSTFFLSNIYFYFSDQLYGSTSSFYKPFLHTWSLGVEIQYYIIFPLLILVYLKFFKKLRSSFFIIFIIISLTLSIYLADLGVDRLEYSYFNFYLLPSRIWEIFIGALAVFYNIKISERKRSSLSFLSVLLIVLSLLFFKDTTKHPSAITLIPVFSTFALIILASEKNFITKILSFKIFVYVGLISYSLYIWHYPIFSFFRISGYLSDSSYQKIIIIMSVLFFSTLSYFCLEKPFRNKKIISSKNLLIFFLTTILLILFLNLNIIKNKGFKERLPEILSKQSLVKPWNQTKIDNDDPDLALTCFGREDKHCSYINKKNSKNIYLIGSSRMASIQENFKNKFIENGFNTYLLTGCINCDYDKIIKKNSIIVFELENTFNNYSLDEKSKIINNFLKQGNTVALIYPIPMPGTNVPMKLFAALPKNKKKAEEVLKSRKYIVKTSHYNYNKNNTKIISFFKKIEHKNILHIYPDDIFCNKIIEGYCLTHDDKDLFYYDEGHLDNKGSEMLSELIFGKIKSKLD
tara:strand:+ start:259 stop:2160 length:1902 start_codon:yes stop_codon:yes gene_type:complete